MANTNTKMKMVTPVAENPKSETPRERFLRILQRRLPEVETNILRLRNLSNRGSYNYTSKDVAALETLLNKWVKTAIESFRKPSSSIEPDYMKLFDNQ